MKFLNIDSPFMQIMNKVADLMILNLLTIVCMIPLITTGAALTAMHYQVLGLVLGGDFYIMRMSETEFHVIFRAILGAIAIFTVFTLLFVFPVQAKFANPVFRTIRNALAMSILQAPKSVVMLVLYVLPMVIVIFVPNVFPLVMLFGMTVPAFLSAKMYNKFFLKLEDRINEANGAGGGAEQEDDGEKIFHDKLDTTLEEKNIG